MLVEGLRIVIPIIMKTHIYEFDGKLKMQVKGGPIGMELTGVLAKVFMVWWDKEFNRIMSKLKINNMLYERYVDDINHGLNKTEEGMKYESLLS